MNDDVGKTLVKVYLVGGKEITHTYSLPKLGEEWDKLVEDIIDRTEILSRSRSGLLWFDNPLVTYNPENVLGIELSTIGVKELEKLNEILRKAQTKKAGFIKD